MRTTGSTTPWLRHHLYRLAIGCLALALPVAGQDPDRSRNNSGSQQSAFDDKISFGFLVGTTATTDFQTGYRGALDTLTGYQREPGAPIEEITGTQIQYSTREPLQPLFGAFAETSLAGNLALQAALLYRRGGGNYLNVIDFEIPFRGTEQTWIHSRITMMKFDTWEIPVTLKYRFGTSSARPFIGVGPSFRIWNLDNSYGASSAVGFDILWRGRFVISPQARYTRWSGGYQMIRNQVQFTVGFTF